MILAAVGCCCRLLLLADGQGTKRIHFSFLRNNCEVNPASRVSVASDAAMVVTSLKSVLKLFLLEGKLIGVCWLEISIRLLGSRRSQSRIQGICGIRRGDGSHVVEVGTETVSPGRKVDRRVLEISTRLLLSYLVSGDRSATRPNQPPRQGRCGGIQSVRKNRMALSQAQEVATRHEMEE